MNESKISPWIRPGLILWAAFMALGIALLAGGIELAVPGAGLQFGSAVMTVLGQVPPWLAQSLQALFGFYAIGKSGEKIAHALAGAKSTSVPAPVPARLVPDDPDERS